MILTSFSFDISSPDSYHTIDPRASLAPSMDDFPNPPVDIKPVSSSAQMPAPPSAAKNNNKNKASLSLDQTQHSAAMLCDLQCRSSETSPSRWSQIILIFWLMHLNIMTFYNPLMIASWSLWPSRMAQMLTSISTTVSSVSTTTMSPRALRRLMTTSSSLPPTLTTSITLFSHLVSLSLRHPAWMTLAQSIATGPLPKDISATALPFENEIEFQKVIEAAMLRVSAIGYHGRSGRSGGDTLGKSSSEERKDDTDAT